MTATPACRFCRAPLTQTFLDLGLQPLANSYLTREQLEAGTEGTYPLHTRVCGRCFLVQADDVVPAEAIFDAEYAYFSSYSAGWVAHARRYAEAMAERFGLGPESLVIEVASNDGYLLQHFVAMDVPVLGIEPTANTAEAARAKGVRTETVFFNEQTAQALAARGDRADLMAANNVLAHVPDINGFVAGFRHVLKPEGVLTFEFPHLLNLIEQVQFDTIYHEHFSYLSLLAVEQVLAAHDLMAFDVERLPTHGGSLRLYCALRSSGHAETDALRALRADEAAAGLGRIETYAGFTPRVEAVRESFRAFLEQARWDGKEIAAYGAAAKGNTFLNYCGATASDIVCAFDANPAKQGRYLPGSHVPILAPDKVAEVRPDYVLILPWNLKDEIMGQLAFIRDWGGRFVVASPRTQVLD
ncbi:SAM-dependent methyltransferase [Phenylobacterium zucineum HLK1]|uniref:SAM-dependent methyltransferase n=1 Tax=Phenylobacterium zucineum (strain HLK1) TaxID=450851 RepID=B4REG8_PHEZH|nr:class I SAM-dependent methyltransferase [Phenylobacterium zucineum]ACG76910.1 SAM-dependent methyltransferase [Phenylobacterium zucineum HLK1]